MVNRENITRHQVHGLVRLILEDLHNKTELEKICLKRGIHLRSAVQIESLFQHMAGLVLHRLDYESIPLQQLLRSLSLSEPNKSEDEKTRDRELLDQYESLVD